MPWPIENYTDFGDGIDRRLASNNPDFPPTALWDALNVVYERESSEPETIAGMARLGTTDIGSGGRNYVSGLFDYADGTELIATCNDGKLYVYTAASANWAAVTTGARKDSNSTATTTRWNGTMYYGATTVANLLILCNGIDAPIKYTTSGGATSLGGSPPSTGQYPVPFVGRLWMASADVLYYSAANDCEDWTTNGGSIQVDRGSGDITSLYIFAGNLIIFKHDRIYRILPTNALTEVAVRPVSSTIGTVSHASVKEAVTSSRQMLIFLSDFGLRALVPTSTTGGFYTPDISSPVQKLLERRFTSTQSTMWGVYNERRSEYYLNYGTASTLPSEGLICNLARSNGGLRFTRHNFANMTAGTIYTISGVKEQLSGDSNGKVYKWHTGYDRDGSSYRSMVYTATLTQGRSDYMKQYGRIFLDVQTLGNYPLTVRMNVGRWGMPAPSGNVERPEDFGTDDSWGVGEWGVALWGGATVRGAHVRLNKVSRGSYIRIIVETPGPNNWFRLNGLKVEALLGSPSPIA